MRSKFHSAAELLPFHFQRSCFGEYEIPLPPVASLLVYIGFIRLFCLLRTNL